MADENTYGQALRDRAGDLAHRAIDAITGTIHAPSAPIKPAATSQSAAQHLGTGIASQGASTISGRQQQIDQAVTDAGG